MAAPIKVALAGNPNSGKTCLFNHLTGSRQHVGNYPGVTVERRSGLCRDGAESIELVDLPGTYSLTSHSLEERVARRFIVDERPDVVVNVVDATNLERNLYLTTQLLDLGVPLVLALNMSDEAEDLGIRVDLDRLGHLFNAPVVATVGHRGRGTRELVEAIQAAAASAGRPPQLEYRPSFEREVAAMEETLATNPRLNGYPARWAAVKLLEGDAELGRELLDDDLAGRLDEAGSRIRTSCGEEPELVVAQSRYSFIAGVCQEAVELPATSPRTLSDHIDRVVTDRWLAFPVFLGLMYAVFQLTFTLGEAPMGWIESGFGWLGTSVAGLWPAGSESVLRSLVVDGIIGGVGGVVVFLPNILLLFLAIALLEDSGYMARAAFIMDRLMHAIGLHGKSFIPLLIGFGCSVPAIMATRSLDNRRDRLTTMLVLPLMSCGARLPIYALIIPAFLPSLWRAPALWLIYVIGIALAVVAARILRTTVFAGPSLPFVMELPPYRVPSLRSILHHVWERSWMYLKKAGTVILGISIVLWALTTYPTAPPVDELEAAASGQSVEEAQAAADLAHSVAGRVGGLLEPALTPLGFDWRIGTALIGAVAAKEVFVAQMGIVAALGEADEESSSLRGFLAESYSPLVGFCIMLFCLISAPCMATLAVVRRESGSWGWAIGQWFGLTALAWVVTAIVYQIGHALAIGV